MRGRKSNLDPDTKYKIVQMYRSGERVIDIAKEFHIRSSTVSNLIHNLGLSRQVHNLVVGRYENILKLYNTGMKNNDIAKAINCSPTVVSMVLRKNGICRYKKGSIAASARKIELPEPEVCSDPPAVEERFIICGKKYIDVTDRIFDDGSNEIYYGSAMEMCL